MKMQATWSIALLALCPMSGVSHAAETADRCYSASEVSQIMAGEESKFVVMANQVVPDVSQTNSEGSHPAKYEGRYFYLNPETHKGYIITSDTPMGRPPQCARIETKLDSATLFDARLTVIDPLAKVNGDRSRAARECAAFGPAGSCGYHNDFLATGLKNGFNVFLEGVIQTKAPNGTPRAGYASYD